MGSTSGGKAMNHLVRIVGDFAFGVLFILGGSVLLTLLVLGWDEYVAVDNGTLAIGIPMVSVGILCFGVMALGSGIRRFHVWRDECRVEAWAKCPNCGRTDGGYNPVFEECAHCSAPDL